MAYTNPTAIENYINATHKLAQAVAQKIYDDATPKLIRLVKTQMKKEDEFFIGMGTSGFSRDHNFIDYKYSEQIAEMLGRSQYSYNGDDHANFKLTDFKK